MFVAVKSISKCTTDALDRGKTCLDANKYLIAKGNGISYNKTNVCPIISGAMKVSLEVGDGIRGSQIDFTDLPTV